MPDYTPKLNLVMPLVPDTPSELREAIASNATTIDGALASPNGFASLDSTGHVPYEQLRQRYSFASGAYNALEGDWVLAAVGSTITLPPVGATGTRVGVTAYTSVTATSPVSVNGTSIRGVGLPLAGASRIVIGVPGATVWFESDGSHWWIIAGAQDTGWVTPSLNSELAGRYFGARLIGDRVFLKGAVTAPFSVSVQNGLWTIPTAMQPAANEIDIPVMTDERIANVLVIETQTTVGLVVSLGPNDGWLCLDGASYSIT